jgi:acyl carrier protein
MMIDVIKDKIKEIAFKKVGDNDELYLSGILTSILVIDLATTLEEEFSVVIPFNEITMETFSTPALIQKYIESKLG